MANTHIIETALLLLIAFLIGCAIGWFVRTRFFGAPGTSSVPRAEPASTAKPADTASTSSVASTSEPAAPSPAEPEPAVKKAAAKKPAAKSTGSKPATAKSSSPKTATTKKPAAKKPSAAKSSTAKKPAAKKPATESAVSAKPAAPTGDAGRPEGLSAPRNGQKDDLKRIGGVGPKLESTLNGLGIYHFDQIAGWDRQTIEWVDNYLSFKGRIDRDNWIEQSKKFADE